LTLSRDTVHGKTMSTASPLELTWSFIAALGIVFSLWAVVDDWLDLGAVKRAIKLGRAVPWGRRWWGSIGFLVADSGFLLAWTGFLIIGAVAILLPPAASSERAEANTITGWVLVGLEADLLLVQVWWRVVRSVLNTRNKRFRPKGP
jgi:hypothetical protein